MADHDFTPFAHLTAPNAELYRLVMDAFVQAKRRFVVHLRPEDVQASLERGLGRGLGPGLGHGLRPDGDPSAEVGGVTEALSSLVEWGNLRADPDTSRVTTVEDFHRARFLYQLSPPGEAAEQALAVYDAALDRRGALQAVALADIVGQLRALLELAEPDADDPAKVHLLLRGLVDRFTELADNAQVFMRSLQRTIDLQDADPDAFRAYKDRLIDYLERFVADLVTTGAEIAALVTAIERAGEGRLLRAAAWREAEDVAPGITDDEDPQRIAFEASLAGWRDRWSGLRQWFLSTPQQPGQAKLLRARARAAIPELLRVVATLNDRRSGRSDRSADFRTLAVWFAQAPDEQTMHRLWRAAFGLSSARHLSIDAATLAERAEHPVPAGTPWARAPSLLISPQLRRTGSYERRGKPNRVIDRGDARRHLAAIAQRQAAETVDARSRLVTAGPIRLSELGELDPREFRLFLGLLGDALAARRIGQRRVVTTTADGAMEVRLTALEDGTTARIPTTVGVLRGPDHLVEIIDLLAPDAASELLEERSA